MILVMRRRPGDEDDQNSKEDWNYRRTTANKDIENTEHTGNSDGHRDGGEDYHSKTSKDNDDNVGDCNKVARVL